MVSQINPIKHIVICLSIVRTCIFGHSPLLNKDPSYSVAPPSSPATEYTHAQVDVASKEIMASCSNSYISEKERQSLSLTAGLYFLMSTIYHNKRRAVSYLAFTERITRRLFLWKNSPVNLKWWVIKHNKQDHSIKMPISSIVMHCCYVF